MTRIRIMTVAALVVAFAAIAIVVVPSGEGRTVVARFAAATNLVDGAHVTAGGTPVGKVESIELVDGFAEVRMSITDDAVWPLRRGTKAQIRFGGTVSYSNRYVDLRPGPASAPALPEGARLPTVDALSAVEIDDVLDTFDAPTRASLGDLIDTTSRTLGPRGEEIGEGLQRAAPATAAAAEVFDQLGHDPQALRTLVREGARTAAALRNDRDELVAVAQDAGTTFRAIAQRSDATQRTLRGLPGTLDTSRATLLRMRPTITRLDAVATGLAPGSRALRRLAGPLATAVGTLDDVAPRLGRTLRTLQRGAPDITALLTAARPVLGDLAPVLRDLGPMVACLRPYATQVAAFGTNWGSATTNYDARGHVGYINVTEFPYPNATPLTPEQATSMTPGLGYRYLRPPGYNAGNSFFLPDCGVDERGLDPKADPEGQR